MTEILTFLDKHFIGIVITILLILLILNGKD